MMRSKAIKWPKKVPELTTPRLFLRGFTVKDTQSYFPLNSNRQVRKMYGVQRHKSLAETRALILWLQQQFRQQRLIRWAIVQRSDQQLVGDMGFWRFIESRARAEIGAKLLPAFWGGGFATEALTAVLDCAFSELNMQSVEAHVESSNAGSLGLVQKLGFAKIGTLPKHAYSDATKTYVDTTLYNFHSEQWHSRSKCE